MPNRRTDKTDETHYTVDFGAQANVESGIVVPTFDETARP